MPEYVPNKAPGDAITSQASAAVTGGQLVAVSGPGTVAPAGAGTGTWLGVASNDAAVNDRVTVHCMGVQLLTASSAITAGDRVQSAANGQVAGFSGTDYSLLLGIALTTAVAGAKVQVKFVR